MNSHEQFDQLTDDSSNPWASAMADMPPFDQRDDIPNQDSKDRALNIQEQEQQAREQNAETGSNAIDAMIARAESDGYTPKSQGELSVLSVNESGQVRIESQYRQLWSSLAQQNPDFYNDVVNHDFSTTLYNLGNSAMFQDLDPDSLDSKKTFSKVYNECLKLKALTKNPEFSQRASEFLEQLAELGDAGETISAIFDIVEEDSPIKTNIDPAANAEPQQKQITYNNLAERYNEALSSGMIDSDELNELAKAYHKLDGFADAAERADTLTELSDRLESLVDSIG